MPYRERRDTAVSSQRPTAANVLTDWRAGLPSLTGSLVTIRELSLADAPSLFASLTSPEVVEFISAPAADVSGFERFIESMHRQRAAGEGAGFAVVPHGSTQAIGVFQVRSLGPGLATAEWGFAIASPFWGNGMFPDAARLAAAFAFESMGVERLEARAAAANGRANGALRKIGAVFEAALRRSFFCRGTYHDQALWAILREEWREAKAVWGPRIVLH